VPSDACSAKHATDTFYGVLFPVLFFPLQLSVHLPNPNQLMPLIRNCRLLTKTILRSDVQVNGPLSAVRPVALSKDIAT